MERSYLLGTMGQKYCVASITKLLLSLVWRRKCIIFRHIHLKIHIVHGFHTHVRRVTAAKYGGSIVTFSDGQTMEFQVSKSTMDFQLHRTAQFRFIFEEQLKPIKNKELLETLLKALGYEID